MASTPQPSPVPSTNIIRTIVDSKKPLAAVLRYVLLFTIVIFGLSNIFFITASSNGKDVYRKDFRQDYTMVRAALAGIDPYLPHPELSRMFNLPILGDTIPHASPHPPSIVVLTLPFGLLPYIQASIAWYIFELICVLITAWLLLDGLNIKTSGWKKVLYIIFFALIAFMWYPLVKDISWGQFSTVMLLLLTAAWRALRSGKNVLAGVLLGILLSIKFIAWPIFLYLLLIRRFRPIISAGVVFLFTNLLAGLWIGFDRILYYYTTLSGQLFMLYRAHDWNFSLFTIGWRLFEGTGGGPFSQTSAPPLVASPLLARIVWIGLPVLVLIIGLWAALRTRDFDLAFVGLVLLSILLSPIAWEHYYAVALLPIAVLLKRLFELNFPGFETIAAVFLALVLAFPKSYIEPLAMAFLIKKVGNIYYLSFAGTLSTWIPIAATLFFCSLLFYLGSKSAKEPVKQAAIVTSY